MSEPIVLRELRTRVDSEYVGFSPNGSSIKPVHIAGGALRCIYGAYNTTMNIKHIALASDAKGEVPKGNDVDSIRTELIDNDAIDESVTTASIDSMRNVMQRLLSADKGVYVVQGLKDGMISYSAGSKHFLTRKAMYEDAGEFIGDVIREYCPELAQHIKYILEKGDDPITLLFEPVLEDDTMVTYEVARHDSCPAFFQPNEAMTLFIQSIKEGGNCLTANLKQHTNSLTQLRLFNLFCVFQIIRYMTMLEAFYCNDPCKPILLDFTGSAPRLSSVARASEMSYTQMYKAINRFYAWGYAELLKDYSKEELLTSSTPVYEKGKEPTDASKKELNTLWEVAKEHASQSDCIDDIRLILGETIYDMLAMEASSHPVNYIRAMGTSAGILYPPDKLHPNKRFSVSQDVLEMILRGCVSPNEVLSSTEIRHRLWERFGIIVGGSTYEIEKIQASGMLLQVDEDALEENFQFFSSTLEAMGFAEVMADGILQIRLGGVIND